MRNLEQIRARRAFAIATATSQKSENERDEYLRLSRSLPAMFQNNGLLATWAFLLSKKDKNSASLPVMEILLAHYRDEAIELVAAGHDSPEEVFKNQWVRQGSSIEGPQLMKLTAEAITFSGWLKRAAEALCDR
ncbi:MAG: type III-B CRISPR module-associated protein Cmr5 [Calditrichaeota bacterium]|nr:type III-B CRISPR module-associated protein Cmr5 [Calditrichota bacterium]